MWIGIDEQPRMSCLVRTAHSVDNQSASYASTLKRRIDEEIF